MSTPRIHRFDFSALRDFRGPVAMRAPLPAEAEEIAAAPPPPPVFSEQDIEAARLAGKKQGYSEGFIAGQQEAKKQADLRTEESNAIIATLGETVRDLESRYRSMLETESRYLSALVKASARKVAGEALDARGEQTITAIIERCMPVIFSKPRLTVELNPEMFEHTKTRVEAQLRNSGFEGDIQFKTNHALAASDVNLDWDSGQMQRSATALWSEIEALIDRVPLELTFADTLNINQNTTGE